MLRVLLVDEDGAAGAGLSRRLARAGPLQLIGAASNVDEARRLLGSALVDLVLVDSHNREDEFDLWRALGRLTQAPIVVLASFMTSQRWAGASCAGATAYLLKEIDTARLVRELQRIADNTERHPR